MVCMFALGGCVQGFKGMVAPLTAPDAEIVSGGPNDVSIRTWGWTRPDKVADEHCRNHDKRAVFESELRIGGEYTDKRLHFYRCIG